MDDKIKRLENEMAVKEFEKFQNLFDEDEEVTIETFIELTNNKGEDEDE